MDFPVEQLKKDLTLLKNKLSDTLEDFDNEGFQKKLAGAFKASSLFCS